MESRRERDAVVALNRATISGGIIARGTARSIAIRGREQRSTNKEDNNTQCGLERQRLAVMQRR